MKSYVVVEAADGLAGLWKAQELQPDLVILDIGLPKLNGIEVARRILKSAPGTKIVFVSEQRSSDIVEEALRTGARGYVVKSDAGRDLLSAVRAVLGGKRFVSASLASIDSADSEDQSGQREWQPIPPTATGKCCNGSMSAALRVTFG